MSDTQIAMITMGVFWAFGFLAGATLFYSIGRRHGIEVMAQSYREWTRGKNDEAIAKIAAHANAKVRGDSKAKDRSP